MVTVWINTFIISILIFMVAYVSNAGFLTVIPTLIIIAVSSYTLLKILKRTSFTINHRIARFFIVTVLLALTFLFKYLIFFDSTGVTLALKIILYHLVFLSGLLIGFYEDLPFRDRSWLHIAIIFAIPVIFFILVAKDNPPSSALFVFNRNPFAGYTLSASAILLGFGTRTQPITLLTYVAIVCIALLINSTLGALLAFIMAVLIYFAPRILKNFKLIIGVATLLVFILLPLGFLVMSLPGVENIIIFERLNFVHGLFQNMFRGYKGSWLDLDMATAVRFAPSGDLDMSAIFRILHWIDIFSVLSEGGNSAMLLGGGTDWISENENRFTYRLAAHNEYVRILVEQGLILGISIIASIFAGIWSIRRSHFFIPLFSLTVYFASENLINDFATTSIFFFVLGHTIAFERRS